MATMPITGAADTHIRVAIADDERLARERLRRLLAAQHDVQVLFEAADGASTVAAVLEHAPDLLFLDIRMPAGDGFHVASELHTRLGAERMPIVIFVTAFDDQAVRAFEAQALDYLVKPFDDARFNQTMERARRRLGQQRIGAAAASFSALLLAAGLVRDRAQTEATPDSTTSVPPGTASAAAAGTASAAAAGTAHAAAAGTASVAAAGTASAAAAGAASGSAAPEHTTGRMDRIVVKRGGSSRLIMAATVDWIEAEGVYSRLHIADDSFLIRVPMHELETRLDPRRFARVHRSTIVNLDRVRELYSSENTLVLQDGTVLAISRSRKAQLARRLGQSL